MIEEKLARTIDRFRSALEREIASIVGSAGYIKSDDIVDDDACDNVVSSAQQIIIDFNRLAEQLKIDRLIVPHNLPPSSHQE
jgi:hypothetical protein